MARFDLSQYETVEERIRRFYETFEDGRITTECEIRGEEGKWLFKAYIYLTAGDQANNLPKATGYASETEGGAQTDWKAELGETSAIGRALANANFSGNKRASREEMQKVNSKDYLAQADSLEDVDSLRTLYTNAKAANAPTEVLDRIKDRAELLAKSKTAGAGRSVSNSKNAGK